MIDFAHAIDSAWERMNILLFRPFDIRKWCVVGFAAFLASLCEGKFNPNFNSFNNGSNLHQRSTRIFDGDSTDLAGSWAGSWNALSFTPWLILLFVVIFVAVFSIILVLTWLGARGQFLILDNLVHNRGAIAVPWRKYASGGNRVFGFLLLYGLLTLFALVVPIIALLMVIPLAFWKKLGSAAQAKAVLPNTVLLTELIGISLLFVAILVVSSLGSFIFRSFGIPLMYRHGIGAWAAFRASLGLASRHIGSLLVLISIRFALTVFMVAVVLLICCATCCLGALPYVSTVLTLPYHVFVRNLTLNVLAQFGPEYDLWDPPSASV